MRTQEMLRTSPESTAIDEDLLAECIEACYECAQACTACADACLAEDMVADLRHCIRTNLDCADVCDATGRILSRQTKPNLDLVRSQVGAMTQAVNACGSECEKHADMHEHCRICAEACQRCREACEDVLNALEGVSAEEDLAAA